MEKIDLASFIWGMEDQADMYCMCLQYVCTFFCTESSCHQVKFLVWTYLLLKLSLTREKERYGGKWLVTFLLDYMEYWFRWKMYIYTHAYPHTHASMHIHKHTYMHKRACIHTYIHKHTHMHTCTHTHAYNINNSLVSCLYVGINT